MKITVENTSKIVTLNGVPARIWEGFTESGIECHCYITRIAIDKDEPRSEEFRNRSYTDSYDIVVSCYSFQS